MRSVFFEFNVAASALYVARGNLEVTNNNIANAAVAGYSRQYAEQRASWPLTFMNGKGMVGTGAEIYGIGQMRDFYLDKRYWSETGVLGEYGMKATQLALSQSILNEASSTGLSAAFTDLYNKAQDLSQKPEDATYRTNFLQSADALAKLVNSSAQSLRKQQADINNEVRTMADIVNSLGQRIRTLNEQISKYEIDGSRANDLRDERTRLCDELSRYVNIEVKEAEANPDYAAGMYPDPEDRGKSDKRFSVLINGYEFVNHYNVNLLQVTERTAGQRRNAMDADGLYDISFVNGTQFDIYNPNLKGQLKGLIDIRDGNNGNNGANGATTSYKGIPHYLNKLNTLVQVFAKAMNLGLDQFDNQISGVIGQENGYDQLGNRGQYSLFTYDGLDRVAYDAASGIDDYANINCFNFQVNRALLTDVRFLATSVSNLSGESDNNVVLGYAKVKESKSLYSEGMLGDYINGIASELGIDVKQAGSFTNNYTDVTTTIDMQRQSVSSVDLNEEIINMIKSQQLYQAAAKLINVIDGIYDTTINRLGLI